MDSQQGEEAATRTRSADDGGNAAMSMDADSSTGEASSPLPNSGATNDGIICADDADGAQVNSSAPEAVAQPDGSSPSHAGEDGSLPSASPSKLTRSKSKSRRPGAVTTLGRDGQDYRHLASASQRSKWRPPTPERTRHQGTKKSRGGGPSARSTAGGNSGSLLSNLGGGSGQDGNGPAPSSSSSWFGGFFSSSSASKLASAGTTDGSSARFTALDSSTDMHPEQIVTDMAIARANRRRQQQRRQQRQAGMPFHGHKKRSKLIRKGDRHLLQQHQSEDGNHNDISANGNVDINADTVGRVLMTPTEMEEAEDNFQDELSSDQQQRQRTREEQIRDECNFFYTGMDDDPTAKAAELRKRARNNSRSSTSRFGRRRGGGRGLMATDDDGDCDHELENGDVRGLYYAASGEDGAMALDLEAGGYYSNNAEERDAFLARHESLNAYVKPPPSRHKRRGRFSGGIHTAVLPGDDHDLRLDQDVQSPASPSSSLASSSVYSSAVSSLHSLTREGGAMQLDEPPPSPSSVAIVSDSLRQSSLLYIHAESGMVQLRLPTDNVRLLMDPHLEPGILSVERVKVGKDGKFAGDDFAAAPAVPCLGMARSRDDDENLDAGTGLESYPATEKLLGDGDAECQNQSSKKGPTNKCPWKEEELHYVLTVDDDLYRRLVKEMADSRTVCGIYYCCHTTEGDENRVSIGVALCVLFVVFTLLLVETIIHPH